MNTLDNPFLVSKPLPVKLISRGYAKEIGDEDDKTKRVEHGKKRVYLDDEEFVKVYPRLFKLMTDFSKVDTRMLEHMLDLITVSVERFLDFDGGKQHYGSDYITIKADVFGKNNNIGQSTVTRCLRKFISLNILAKGNKPHKFWVNPYMLFIGDRSRRYKKYIVVIDNDEERTFEQSK